MPLTATQLAEDLQNGLHSQGVVREIVLLRVLNSVLDQYATTDDDWRTVSPTEYRHWREQVLRLLNYLEFIIASADSYASEPTELNATCQQLQAEHERTQQELNVLRQKKRDLEADCAHLATDKQSLLQEVELLTTLREVLPWREQVVAELSENRLRALRDTDLAKHIQTRQHRINELAETIRNHLQEQERLLADGLELEEREWQGLRRRVDGLNRETS
ncbi:hypothetical protein [Methylotuvimicrobium sp. KM2]|uniref:hypothetical protein n=1 Tax=Methylotuvimicrobium sp. KM2 TaxID=3133976 RepID=UPI0031016CDB